MAAQPCDILVSSRSSEQASFRYAGITVATWHFGRELAVGNNKTECTAVWHLGFTLVVRISATLEMKAECACNFFPTRLLIFASARYKWSKCALPGGQRVGGCWPSAKSSCSSGPGPSQCKVSGGRQLQQGGSESALRGDREEPRPARYPGSAGGRTEQPKGRNVSVPRQEP